jgi:excisionase family DNA binding protein
MKFLKPNEFGKELRICPSTVHKLLISGQIPGAFKLGGSWRIPVAAVEAWLAKGAA